MNSKLSNYLNTIMVTNNELSDLIDINKIINNVDLVEMDLNQLNYILTGVFSEFYLRVQKLFIRNPNCFKVLPILIGIRNPDEYQILKENKVIFIDELTDNIDNIVYFFEYSGIAKLIKENKIRNFIDYVTGVEIGLDTNARKNRNGKKRETFISHLLHSYFEQYPWIKIEEQKKVPGLIDESNKVYDFVITNPRTNQTILLECSFYNAQGSKISETARAYNKIYNEIKEYKNYTFLWLADGKGMKSIVNTLQRLDNIDYIINTSQLIDQIKKIV